MHFIRDLFAWLIAATLMLGVEARAQQLGTPLPMPASAPQPPIAVAQAPPAPGRAPAPVETYGRPYGRSMRGMQSNINQSGSGRSMAEIYAAQPLEMGIPYGRRFRGMQSNINQSAGGRNVAEGYAQEPVTEGALYGRSPRGMQTNVNEAAGGRSAAEREAASVERGRGGVSGTIPLPEKPRPYQPNMPPRKRAVEAEFQDGVTVKTTDDYFSLTFHNLTQVDYRDFQPEGDPLVDSFVIPRQRWYVLGNLSPNARYYTVINRGYNSIDLLDAFIDFNFGVFDSDKFSIRVGRMKTPYTYEYWKISENDLIAPERSVFVGNLAPNREIGAMAHGQIADKRFEYAVGVFNGPRRSFIDYNSSKDFFSFVNTKPFLNTNIDLLKQLNVGGSFNFGYEHNPTQPAVFRTASDQSTGTTANQVSPTFLAFNSNVFEQGLRMQWSGDIAYYYKSLGIVAGYQGGYQNYGISSTTIPSDFVGVTAAKTVKVPMEGWSCAVFYFLTGEEITRRVALLEPRSTFTSLKKRGMGSIEAFSRVANMELGDSIFTGGLATANGMTNRLNVFDNGINWYLNHYLKLTFDWQYSQYASPVDVAPGKATKHQNIFWSRAQLFF